jgi:hypothetical protein
MALLSLGDLTGELGDDLHDFLADLIGNEAADFAVYTAKGDTATTTSQ